MWACKFTKRGRGNRVESSRIFDLVRVGVLTPFSALDQKMSWNFKVGLRDLMNTEDAFSKSGFAALDVREPVFRTADRAADVVSFILK